MPRDERFYHYVLSFTAKASEWYIQHTRDQDIQFVGRAGGKFCLTLDEKSAARFPTQHDARNALSAALDRGELKP